MTATVSGAILSEDEVYRYALFRDWSGLPDGSPRSATMLFVMLNPSTADATTDDPTIRRCRSFAEREGCTALVVGNLYAYRATKPTALWAAQTAGVDIVGPNNDAVLRALTGRAGVVVCAWGAGFRGIGTVKDVLPRLARARAVRELLSGLDVGAFLRPLHALGLTADGSPRHPLYVRGDQPLEALR